LLRSIRAPAGSVNTRCGGQAALAHAAFFMVAARASSAENAERINGAVQLLLGADARTADSNAPAGIDGLAGGRDSTLERPRVTPQYPSLGCT